MSTTLAKDYHSALLEAIPAYQEAGEKWPATVRELAVFAINNESWQAQRSKLVS